MSQPEPSALAESASTVGGIPMSTTLTSPAYSGPSPRTSPDLSAPMQTVREATTVRSSWANPESLSSPVGTSRETTASKASQSSARASTARAGPARADPEQGVDGHERAVARAVDPVRDEAAELAAIGRGRDVLEVQPAELVVLEALEQREVAPRVLGPVLRAGCREDEHPRAADREHAGEREPVPAVVALAREHEDGEPSLGPAHSSSSARAPRAAVSMSANPGTPSSWIVARSAARMASVERTGRERAFCMGASCEVASPAPVAEAEKAAPPAAQNSEPVSVPE